MNYKLYNDYELISMVRENDEDSYDLLFRKYTPIIKKIAFEYYKSYSTYGYELDDFIQEGYVAFQKALVKYNPLKDALFYTFVVLCLHRNLISFSHRISNDKKNISNTYFVSIDDTFLTDGINYEEDYYIRQDVFNSIWDIVYTSSLESICVFELRWNHFKFDEISKLLDIPIRRCQTVYKKILFNIQKKLSNNL